MVLGSPLETTYDVILKLLQIKTRTLLDFLNENKNVIDCSEFLASFLCLFPHFPLLFDFGSFSKINPRALFGFLIFPYFDFFGYFLFILPSHFFFLALVSFLISDRPVLGLSIYRSFVHILSFLTPLLFPSCIFMYRPFFPSFPSSFQFAFSSISSSLLLSHYFPSSPSHPLLFTSHLTFPSYLFIASFFQFFLAVSFSLVPRLFTSYSFFLSSSFPPKGDDKRVA